MVFGVAYVKPDSVGMVSHHLFWDRLRRESHRMLSCPWKKYLFQCARNAACCRVIISLWAIVHALLFLRSVDYVRIFLKLEDWLGHVGIATEIKLINSSIFFGKFLY